MSLFIRAMAEVPFRHHEELKDSVWLIPIDRLRPLVPGSELTYAQAFCFATYLIERFSFHTYLDYCAGLVSFEKAFSAEYQVLMEQHKKERHGNI